jgi:hypothetical protein
VEVDGSSVAVSGDVPADDELGGCSTVRGEVAVAYAEALLDVDRWEVQGELLELTGPAPPDHARVAACTSPLLTAAERA